MTAVVTKYRVTARLDRLERVLASEANLDEAMSCLDQARRTREKAVIARAALLAATLADRLGAIGSGFDLAIEAAEAFEQVGDLGGEASARYKIGASLWRQRRFTEALVSLERVLTLATQSGDVTRQIRSLNVMAVILGYLGNFARSQAAYDQALALCSGDGFEIDHLLILNNKAQNYLHRARATSDPVEIVANAEYAHALLVPQALELAERWAPDYRRELRDTVGQALILKKASQEALALFRDNQAMAVASGDEVGAANSRIGIAEAMLDLGDPDSTIEICADVLGSFAGRLSPDDLARAHLILSTSYRRLERHREALEEFTRFHELIRNMSNDVVDQYSRHMAVALELEKSKAEAAAYKRLADELRAAREAAEAGSRAKSEFLSNMSHELRTPLNAIIGFADIMRSQMFGAIAPRYQGYLEDIHRSGEHLLELINQLLDLSKAEAGKLELAEEVLSLDALISDAAMLVRQSALSSGVELTELPTSRVLVRADPLRIKQCLINVMSNAVKFTPKGGRVSVAILTGLDGVAVEIADTGVGLAAEDVEKAFERFGQGGNARAITGTGLGLPLTKQLLELHGGSVDLESTRGVGTTVILRLPSERLVTLDEKLPAA